MTIPSTARQLAATFAVLSLLGGSAQAAMTYTETTDFSGNLGSPFTLPDPLEVGANTISGTLPLSFPGFGFSDADVFYVNNPLGLTVTSITVDIFNYVATATNPANGAGVIRLESPGFDQQLVYGNGRFALVAADGNATQFQFRFFGPQDFGPIGGDFFPPEAGSMSYVVTLNAIPEPSAAALLGVGMLGFAMSRRRRVLG